MKKKATENERAHMGRIAKMQCICCYLLDMKQESKTDVHHIRTDSGGTQRGGHYCTIPLCHNECHQGKLGVHGDKTYIKMLKMTELALLDMVLGMLYGNYR